MASELKIGEGLLLGQSLLDLLGVGQRLAEDEGPNARYAPPECGAGSAGGGLGDHDAGAGVAEVGRMRPLDHYAPVAELATPER